MSMTAEQLAAIQAAAASVEDSSVIQEGGFERQIPPEGTTTARLIGIVDLGVHDGGEYQGKKKADAEFVRFTFELLGPKYLQEFEVDGVKKKVGTIMTVQIKKSQSSKAGFTKLFAKLVYGRGFKHYSQCLNSGYLVTVTHSKNEKGDKTYANLKNAAGEWGIGAPVVFDPISEESKPVPVPAALSDFRLFIWAAPTIESWNALRVEGTREVKTKVMGADGVETEVTEERSKNWLQEKILSSKTYAGSALYTLLEGVSGLTMQEPVAPAAPVAAAAPVAGAAPVVAATASSASDALAALGITVPAATVDLDLDDNIPF